MKNQKYCSIVQDLLPNYIDDLTCEETSKYIQKHIETCDECRKVLSDMQDDLKLDSVNNDIEIKGLKKVKQRIRLQIFSCIFGMLILFFILIYINNNYIITITDEGKFLIESTNPKISISNFKYLIIEGKRLREGTKDGYIYITHIITVNEKGICVNTRCIEEGYTNDTLINIYRKRIDTQDMNVSTNIEIKEEKLCYNSNPYNGRSKEEIINDLTNYYDEIVISEW